MPTCSSTNPLTERHGAWGTLEARVRDTGVLSFTERQGNLEADRGQGHAAAAAKSLQSCPTLCDPRDGSQPGWDSPGKDTGVSCHFLLQCMKVKSESEVAQSCLTPSDPMDCSLPGSSVHGIFQAKVLEWVAISFSRGSS